jgi:dihydroxyacetone kinase-like predicted kinase
VELNGVRVSEGQVIDYNGTLVVMRRHRRRRCFRCSEHMQAAQHRLITLYYGSDLTGAQANQIKDRVRTRFASVEVELHEGGQPHYPFILSVE